MVTWDEVEKKYGKELADKMSKSEWLCGITVTMLPDGRADIPESDIENAYLDTIGKKVSPCRWD